MRYSTHQIYLVIERSGRGYWKSPVIRRITRKKPTLRHDQALVRLDVNLPDGILEPPQIRIEIRPEHIAQAPVKISPTTPPTAS